MMEEQLFCYLKTQFSDEENKTLHAYCDTYKREVAVVYRVTSDLFEDENIVPNKIIEVEGLYLLEKKDSLGKWEIGMYRGSKYSFFEKYDSLKDALSALEG